MVSGHYSNAGTTMREGGQRKKTLPGHVLILAFSAEKTFGSYLLEEKSEMFEFL